MDSLQQFFGLFCGQNHCWTPGGEVLPFCQRCTGFYVGSFVAVVLHLVFRPRSTYVSRWVHGLLLLLMVPFGYHWVPQNDVMRTLTGQLFAAGVVAYLLLVPAAAFGPRQAKGGGSQRGYVLGMATGLTTLQVLVRAPYAWVHLLLTAAGCLGFLALAALALGNLILLPAALKGGKQPDALPLAP